MNTERTRPLKKEMNHVVNMAGLRDRGSRHTAMAISTQGTHPGVLGRLGARRPRRMVGGRTCAVVDLEGIAPPSGLWGVVGSGGSGDRRSGQDGGACDNWLPVVIRAPEMFLLAPLETSPLGTQNGSYSSS